MAAPASPISFGWEPAEEEPFNRPLGLLVAMLLDQQVPITWAFRGPARLEQRLGRPLDAAAVAVLDPEELVEVAVAKPAIHRYPAVMAARIQQACAAVADDWSNDAYNIWGDGADGATVLARLESLPGFGSEKAKITLAVLGKRWGIEAPGWTEACAPFSDDEPRTVADIDGPEALAAVKAWKAQARAAGKAKDG